jgi:hypothetical protein
MNPFKYDVSLRVRHPRMADEEISNALRMEARHHWTVGTPRKTPKGTPLKGTYDSTYCSFRLEHADDTKLSDFLAKCTASLMPHKQFLERICSTGGSIEYFVGWYSGSNSGAVLKSELLRDLAALRIDLSLDVYGATPSKVAKKPGRTKKKKAKKKK